MTAHSSQCLAIELPSLSAEVVQLRRRNARVKTGTRCLWFVRDEGVQFVGTGKIENVRKAKEEGESGPLLEISHTEQFREPRTLDEMAGSLARLREPLKARRSFARQYVRLDQWDYQRIRVRYVDYHRTIFRTLFFALPDTLRIEFLQDSLDLFAPAHFPVVNHYGRLSERLLSYLRGPVARALTMTAFLKEIHEGSGANGLPDLGALTLTDPTGEHSITLGRASLRMQRERGRLLPEWTVHRHLVRQIHDDGVDEEQGLILGLPQSPDDLLAQILPDTSLDGATRVVEQLTNRPWREAIL